MSTPQARQRLGELLTRRTDRPAPYTGLARHRHIFERTTMTKPTIGDIVIYRSKIDNGPGNDVLSPAIVTRTRDTTVAEVIDRWGPEPHEVVSASDPDERHMTAPRPEGVVDELPDDDTVDLAVFGLGQTYREFAVSKGDGRGQWSWPLRV